MVDSIVLLTLVYFVGYLLNGIFVKYSDKSVLVIHLLLKLR